MPKRITEEQLLEATHRTPDSGLRTLLLFWMSTTILLMGYYLLYANTLLSLAKPDANASDTSLLLTYMLSVHFLVSSTFLLALAPLTFPKKKWLRWIAYSLSVLLGASLFLLILLNHMLFSYLGVTIDHHSVLDAVFNASFQRETNISLSSYVSLTSLCLLFLAIQSGLMWLSHRIANSQWMRGTYLVVGAALFGGVGISSMWMTNMSLQRAQRTHAPSLRALPLYQRFFHPVLQQGQLRVRYPHPNLKKYPTLTKPKNIILILAESLRSDMLTAKSMPHAHRYIQQHSCVQSKHHHSGGHSTTWGVFSLLFGLNAYHLSYFFHKKVKSYPIQLLRNNNYQTAGYIASRLRGWDYGGLFGDQFETYQEFYHKKSFQNDRDVVEKVRAFQKNRDPKRPFFLVLFLDSTHHNYLYPPQFEKHKPVLPPNYNHFMVNHKLMKFRNKVMNRYRNSVLYVDHLFQEVMDIFAKENKANNLIVGFTGDHAEEFWDHGLQGHGAPRFINARTQVPLLLCLPNIKSLTVHLSSHTDFWPTIIDNLSPSTPIPIRQYSDGHSLLRSQAKDRYAIVTSFGFPHKQRSLALITLKHKRWLRWKERFNHFDITKYTDLADRSLPKRDHLTDLFYLQRLKRDMMRFFTEKHFVFERSRRMPFQANIRFGSYLRLVGYNYARSSPRKVKLTYLFQVLQPIPKGWRLFFHLEQRQPKQFLNVSHDTASRLLPLEKWKAKQFIRSEHNITIPQHFDKKASLELYMGMWAPRKPRQTIHLGKKPFSVRDRRVLLHRFSMVR